MPAEFVTHRRSELVRELRLAARAEPLVKRGGQHMDWHALVNSGLDRPATFAGVGHAPCEGRHRGITEQGRSREIKQPGGDDAAAAPDLRDLCQFEIVLKV